SDPTSLESPQDVTLVPLSIKNTLGPNALNYGKLFLLNAQQIDGSTDGSSDFYRFYATAGQLINADAASVILASSGHSTSFNTKLVLRDDAGEIVDTNVSGFETSDAQIIDYLVQHSGYYTIEVVSEDQTAGDYRLTLSTFEAINNPATATAVDNM